MVRRHGRRAGHGRRGGLHHHHRAGNFTRRHHHHHGIRIGHNRTVHSGWSAGNVRFGNYRRGRSMPPGIACGVVLLFFGVFIFFPGVTLTIVGNSGQSSTFALGIIGPILLCVSLIIITIGIVLVVLMCKKAKEQQAGQADGPQGTVVQGPGGGVVLAGAVPAGAQPAPYGTEPQTTPYGTGPQLAPYGQPAPYIGNQQPPYGGPYSQPPFVGVPPQGNMYGAGFGTEYSQPGPPPSAPPEANPNPNAAPPPSYEQATEKY
ncbi:basic salivary proline-rich protein 1-like [Lineus longissimus]|uniref:basic salivary proline-rich protein 1-like n=1 Tax=Lineus longissimus TaxID=88925 RepID=UPI002B4E46FF